MSRDDDYRREMNAYGLERFGLLFVPPTPEQLTDARKYAEALEWLGGQSANSANTHDISAQTIE